MSKNPNDERKIETHGGAYVEGDVNVEGDFVGRDKIIINNTVLPTIACHICGKLCQPEDAYSCKRCRQFTCTSHRTESGSPFCPDCAERVRLEHLLSNPDGEIRLQAIQQLFKKADIQTIYPTMKRLRFEANPVVRYWLFYTLGRVGGREAQEFLQKSLQHETDAFVRRGIEEALQIITSTKIP